MPNSIRSFCGRLNSLLVGLSLCGGVVVAGAGPAVKPNIIFILADDLGYGSVGCYGADTNLIRTPNIDRLAREGVRFTDAHTASSVCSPTRYAVLTGRYCWRTSLKHEVLGVFSPLHIETNRLTLASLLKRHGYRTAAIGKWHLGYGNERRTDYTKELRPGPAEIGFDYHFGVPSNHGDVTGVFVENHRVQGLRSTNLAPSGQCYYGGKPFIGLDAPQRQDEEVMSILTDKVVAWLDQQEPSRPFFLYFTPVAVHEPITPSARTSGTSKAGPYGDFIHDLDLSVGRILDALHRRQLAGDTLVVVTSDNGGVNGDGKSRLSEHARQAIDAGLAINGPWRGRKHSIFEGGCRVPYLVRWPGKAPAGLVTGETVSLVDTMATIAAVVGEPLPPATEGAEDSCNVLPAWLGQKADRTARMAMITHSADGVFAIHQGPWKFIEGTPSRAVKNRQAEYEPQLYRVPDDPKETRNLFSQHPEVVTRLGALLKRCREQGHSRPE
jgi:arylsulfatase A-like enzyme